MPNIRRFIDTELYRITGFLHPVDAMALAGLASWQSDHQVEGSVMEIGVFYGRSFALMARCLRPGEKGVAVDLFDIDGSATGESGQLRSFRETMARSGIGHDDLIVVADDSANLDPHVMREAAGEIRLFSIDGGHEEHHVRTDVAFALEMMASDGVIVFDDFFNPQYPDVTVAVLKALAGPLSDWTPFLITRSKLYVSRRQGAVDYGQVTEAMPLWAGAGLERFTFLGEEVLFLSQPLSHRAVYQAAAARGWGGPADRLLRSRTPRHAR